MSFKFHQLGLTKICRVCTNRVKTSTRKPTVCKEFVKEIYNVFDVCTWADTPDQHPHHLCELCARKVRHQRAGTRDYGFKITSLTQRIQKDWQKHPRTGSCDVCELLQKQSQGGPKPSSTKPKRGQPVKVNAQQIILPYDCSSENIFCFLQMPTATFHQQVSASIEIIGHIEQSLFTCAICLCILSRPCVQTPCQHNYCAVCLSAYFTHHKLTELKCPICMKLVNFNKVTASPRVLCVQLDSLDVACNKCSQIGNIHKVVGHKCEVTVDVRPRVTIVKHSKVIESQAKSTTTFSTRVTDAARLLKSLANDHQQGNPIPHEIEQAADKWTWIKLNEHKEHKAYLHTGGRPALVQKVTKTTELESAAKSASDTGQSTMSANQALAMMRDCHLAWDQLRKLKRYIPKGFTISSERKMRKQQDIFIKDNLCGEMIKLVFPSTKADGINGFETKETPFVYINNLPSLILDYLDRLDSAGLLVWHDGVIPKDEVWLKIGGDKGGTSFMMNFQIVNVSHPNSLSNTIVFIVFEGSDSLVNLQCTLPKLMRQIADLATVKWRDKSFRLLCFGDYELLNKTYGLCGCNARYCCIYCKASKEMMQKPLAERGLSPARSLNDIKDNHQHFLKSGAKRSQAKDISFSVVSEPLIPIEVDHVILPSLHISLGVFKKLFDLFESDCHRLDEHLFKLRAQVEDEDEDEDEDEHRDTNFDVQIATSVKQRNHIAEQLTKKKSRLEELEDDLPLYVFQHTEQQDVDAEFRQMATETYQLRVDVHGLEIEMNRADLAYGTGPVVSSLDKVLSRFHVQRQAYHGKSFVGNHVHRCCTVEVIEALTAAPMKVMLENMTDDVPLAAHERLLMESANIKKKYSDIFLKFADVHHGINHARAISPQELNQIDICIKEFLNSFRASFPSSNISPKLHLLEDHAVEQLRKFRVGFGLLNEQGGELIHTDFNRTGRVVHGMRDPLQRLMAVMRRHLVGTTPEVQTNIAKTSRKHEC
ncbi:uncharacterized protein [Asterias amurensis]|uniref:uncharacterized protein isoform X2 n=1 Tax=Asterias amurensis TaxID=7602 RepID=UPI003AB704A2